MTSFQYFLRPKMEADFQFNSYRVIYLSLAYHIEHPLYLRLKLSLFPPNSFTATGPGRFQYYLLLHVDVPDIPDHSEEDLLKQATNRSATALDHFTEI